MEGKLKGLAGAFALALLAMSCDPAQEAPEPGKISAWASFEEYGLDQMRLRVRLEDDSGNVPTGARVYLKDPENAVNWAYFDSDTNLYSAAVSDPLSGLYSVEVESVRGSSVIRIPVTILAENPEILTIQDSAGVVSGQGSRMSAENAIFVAWNPVDGATVYICAVKSGSGTVFSQSTTDISVEIPAHTLDSGRTYSVSVEAQYIVGDPYLRSEKYYAFNYSESPSYYFTLD